MRKADRGRGTGEAEWTGYGGRGCVRAALVRTGPTRVSHTYVLRRVTEAGGEGKEGRLSLRLVRHSPLPAHLARVCGFDAGELAT